MNLPTLAASFFNLGSLEGSMTLIIPIVAIVMPFLFVIVIVGLKFVNERKARQLQLETIRAAIEKGQPIPPELLNMKVSLEEPSKPNDRKAGLILIAVSIGIFIMGSTDESMGFLRNMPDLRLISAIPGLIGVALLINWVLERSGKKDDKN